MARLVAVLDANLTAAQLDRTRQLMGVAVPDARIEGYERLVDQIELPDADDRHVFAAAIAGAPIVSRFLSLSRPSARRCGSWSQGW